MNFQIIFLQAICCFSFIGIYASDHNHSSEHSKQWLRIGNLGQKFDKELENAQRGLTTEFRGIFKAMHRLSDAMVCSNCQKSYRANIEHNIQTVKIIQKQLATGQLPKNDPERGHHA